MLAQYQLRSKVYTIVGCDKKEIPSHFERVSSYWRQPIKNIDTQFARLEQCIDQGIAIKILDEKNIERLICYILPIDSQKRIYGGILLHADSNRFIAIMGHWFYNYKGVFKILFLPKTDNPIPFRKIVDTDSIKRYHYYGTSLVVNPHNGKYQKLIEKYFKLYDIQKVE